MNGIDRIIERIGAEASLKAEEILAEAGRSCEKLKSEYERLAAAESEAALEKGRAQCAALKARMLGEEDMRRRNEVLALKQEMVAQAFAEAEAGLAGLARAEYVEFLSSLAAKAARSGREELVMSDKDRAEVGELVVSAANAKLAERNSRAELKLSSLTRDISGGLFVKEGDIETNCTLSALIAGRFDELTMLVSDKLFGES